MCHSPTETGKRGSEPRLCVSQKSFQRRFCLECSLKNEEEGADKAVMRKREGGWEGIINMCRCLRGGRDERTRVFLELLVLLLGTHLCPSFSLYMIPPVDPLTLSGAALFLLFDQSVSLADLWAPWREGCSIYLSISSTQFSAYSIHAYWSSSTCIYCQCKGPV